MKRLFLLCAVICFAGTHAHAQTAISALPSGTPVVTDVLPYVTMGTTPKVTKKVTVTDLFGLITPARVSASNINGTGTKFQLFTGSFATNDCAKFDVNGNIVTAGAACAGGSGTVSSVGLTVPGVLFSVSGSPITTSGTLALSLLTQTANTVLAGPTSGAAATPTMRALVAADIPDISATYDTLTGAQTLTNKTLTSPKIGTSALDTNGNTLLGITATASAVNYLNVANAASGNNPVLSAAGSGTNIGITLTPKGTGNLTLASGALIVPANYPNGVGFGDANTLIYASGSNFTFYNNSTGNLLRAGSTGLKVQASYMYGFVSGTDATQAIDAGLGRNAARVVEVNNGTAGTFGDLKVRQHYVDQTITAGGTTGAQTINKGAGTVNFAAAATSLVVTDSLVTTSSTIHVVKRTNDATCQIQSVVPAAGSFTINMTAGCGAETSVGFLVIN